MAANEIFYQLSKAKGFKNTIRDQEVIAGVKIPNLESIMKKSSNFFKHSGKDPHKVHTFRTEENVHFLADCCFLYFYLAIEWIPEDRFSMECKLFMMWFIQNYPHLVKGGKLKGEILGLIPKVSEPLTPKKYLETLKGIKKMGKRKGKAGI